MITEALPYLLVVGCCLASQGFFSGTEIALVSANRLQLQADASKHPSSALALRLLESDDRLLGTCLIGTNLSVVTGTTVLAAMFAQLGYVDVPMALLFIPFTLVLGEALPKTVFEHHATFLAPILARPIAMAQRVFALPLWILGGWSRLLSAVTGRHERLTVTRKDLEALLANEEGADIAPEEQELIRRVLEIKDTAIENCMTPLVEVDAIPLGSTVRHAIDVAVRKGRSRLPVYRDRVDKLVGVVKCPELLAADDDEGVERYVRDVPIVPESKRADELLHEMRRAGIPLALVVDEYGGSVGIVSVEDLLEELLGEIRDERDDAPVSIQQVGSTTWRVSARAELEELSEALDVVIPDGDYETVAGLILERLGRIPKVGESIQIEQMSMRVEEATDRQVRSVTIVTLPETPTPMMTDERVSAPIPQPIIEECMTPLVEVHAVAIRESVRTAKTLAAGGGHPRIPVFRERVDELIGVVAITDLLLADDDAPISRYLRRVPILPEVKRVDESLREMRRTGRHFAIVVDEYGGSVGIVTLTDLLEELSDEDDDVGSDIRKVGSRTWRVSARVETEDLSSALETEVPDGDYETVAGMILAELGHIPAPGQVVRIGTLLIRIEEATDRAVRVVSVTVSP